MNTADHQGGSVENEIKSEGAAMVETPVPRRAQWKPSPRYVRSRALAAIFLVSVLQIPAMWDADLVWWLEAPVHFQAQYAVVLTTSLVGLAWVCWAEQKVRLADGLAGLAGLLAGGFALAAMLGVTPAQYALAPPKVAADSPGRGNLRILSANIYSGNTRYQAVLDLVRAEHPDIVLLMELNSRWLTALKPLAEDYSFHQIWPDDIGNFGIGVWSRLPIDEWALNGFGGSYPHVDLVARLPDSDRPFRFLGLHPMPPISAEYAARRNRVYIKVAEGLAAGPKLPVIVAGDMNNTRFAPAFQRFCKDAALYDTAKGRMAWRTWPAGPQGIVTGTRIDHVLIGKDWRVVDFRLGPDIGSDHYPIVADLRLVFSPQ